ncbi:hypothetical protein C8R48DRAFT_675708 [Suillus tomentosus]|nr:hypothetical protein C8R48DRAFT_675708 [Suillus tomentosus]
METDYSADDIAAATSLQFFQPSFDNHILDLQLCLFISRRGNWRFLLVSHWTKAKGLYIATRHVPFLLLATNLYLSFIPNETPGKCRVLDNICSEYCLQPFLLPLLQTFLGASIGITFATTAPATYATSAIPGITGCYQSSSSLQFFIPFLLLCAFELELATKPKPSVHCPVESQHILLYVWSL